MKLARLQRAVAGGAQLALLAGLAGCVRSRVRGTEPSHVLLPPAPSSAVPPSRDSTRPSDRPDPGMPRDPAPRIRSEGERDVRVALATAAQSAVVTASGPWRLFDSHDAVFVRARALDGWTIERRGRELRAMRNGAGATPWSSGPLTLRPERGDAFGIFAGRRYRGSLRAIATDSGLLVVNSLSVEDYLRGVVPLEIGERTVAEHAAAEAQAIAARSYTVVRLGGTGNARNEYYDLLSSVADQVYGGVDAERPFSDHAVSTTAGLVVMYGGRVVNAPYSSSCGGETAEPDEVWRATAEPYLKRVSDRIPGGADRYYCDIAPRFAWTRAFSSPELDAVMRAYLRRYASVPSGGPGHVRSVMIESRTPSGRVARLAIATERGSFSLRGNDIRYVLRAAAGEMLNSTYFTLDSEVGRDGGLTRLVVRGNGYGHGIGMCQWGAIGRARAGQTARAILATYYPGTTVGSAY